MPRLAGIGVAVLLAAGGTAAYLLLPGTAHAGKHADESSARVQTKLAVTIITQRMALRGRARTTAEALAASSTGLVFTVITPSASIGAPMWTADQMTGGSYIFVDVSVGKCLAGPARPVTTTVSLQRCSLGGSQRWKRVLGSAAAAGHHYWQLENAADGLCLTVGSAIPGTGSGHFTAAVERCQDPQPSRQLVTFLSG
jgi:Ricin-type beta-trefoil lectin domain-like